MLAIAELEASLFARRRPGLHFPVAGPGKLPDLRFMAAVTAKSRIRVPASATARLEARIPREFKKTLEEAAAVTGHPTVTSFVLFALQASARRVIEEHRQAKLSAAESAHFVKALLSPDAPNAALRGAYARYREVSA
jgi:uncharacterized protein (DUF1778 family)